jgi:hypothetical protein
VIWDEKRKTFLSCENAIDRAWESVFLCACESFPCFLSGADKREKCSLMLIKKEQYGTVKQN